MNNVSVCKLLTVNEFEKSSTAVWNILPSSFRKLLFYSILLCLQRLNIHKFVFHTKALRF